jgi:hypothetical protein
MAQTRRLYQKMVQGEFPGTTEELCTVVRPRDQRAICGEADRLEQALLRLQQIEESVEQARLELREATNLIRTLVRYGHVDQPADLHRPATSTYSKTVHLPS